MDNWIIYLVDILFVGSAIGVLALFGLLQRNSYVKKTKNHVLGIFWPKVGEWQFELIPIQANGTEIKREREINGEKRTLTYLFDNHSRIPGKYPRIPPLGMSFLQVPLDTICWPIDDANPIRPIDPYNTNERRVANPELIRALDEADAKAVILAANETINELQEKLRQAQLNQFKPINLYISLGIIALGLLAGDYLIYAVFQMVSKMAKLWGIG